MPCHIITSDLHLGSAHCQRAALGAFLDAVPSDATLVLAGDTIDDPTRELSTEDRVILERIYAEAARRRVVLVQGNHDSGWSPGVEELPMQDSYVVDGTVFVSHGDSFDNLMPRNRWFVVWFKRFHRLRVKLGAPPVHVAHYAKNWRFLYRLLRRSVMLNAVQHARENGYAAAVCGHVHFPEHACVEGVDYFNTGSWTEEAFHYVRVHEGTPELLRFDPESNTISSASAGKVR